MNNYKEFKFRADSQSPDFFLWQVYSQWQKGKNKLIEQFDITSPQLTILTSVYWLKQNDHETTQTVIADTANMDRMTTSTVLRTLQKKGLVTRIEHETDTRAKTVSLTDEGIGITVAALRMVDGHNIRYFSPLGDSRESFINHLKNLLTENK